MGKKHKNLYEQIISTESLWSAYYRAIKGKKQSAGYLASRLDAGLMISNLHRELSDGTYRPGSAHRFLVYEPKPRQIDALPFRDRVVQHALCGVIEPIFDKVFLPTSYACRKGKGTHKGVMAVQATLRRMGKVAPVWCLKTDFEKYFHSIPGEVLHREIRRKISCKRTLRLIELYHCPYTLGIKIGWLSSQLLANICGHILDRYLAHQVKAKHWYRYMDDVVIFAHTREYLDALQQELTLFVYEQMGMTWSKWSITPVAAGVNFLGYRVWPTHKLLRRDSVKKAKRKITKLKKLDDPEPLRCFLAAWLGHARWANTHNLITHLEKEHEMALRPSNQRADHRHPAGQRDAAV